MTLSKVDNLNYLMNSPTTNILCSLCDLGWSGKP